MKKHISKERSAAGTALANLNWPKKSKKERLAHISMMNAARKEAQETKKHNAETMREYAEKRY